MTRNTLVKSLYYICLSSIRFCLQFLFFQGKPTRAKRDFGLVSKDLPLWLSKLEIPSDNSALASPGLICKNSLASAAWQMAASLALRGSIKGPLRHSRLAALRAGDLARGLLHVGPRCSMQLNCIFPSRVLSLWPTSGNYISLIQSWIPWFFRRVFDDSSRLPFTNHLLRVNTV